MKLAIFGILLNIFGWFCTTLGYALQRKSHNQIRKNGGAFYKHPLWWISAIILVSATFIYMISMSMTNQSTLSVIGPMGLIISVAMGKFLLNEEVTKYEILGIAFITPGSILTLLFASLNNRRYNREEFELLLQSKLSFCYFMMLVSLFTIGFTFSWIILSLQQNKIQKLDKSDESIAKIENLNEDDEEQIREGVEETAHKHKHHTGSLIKNYTHSRKKLHSFSKKITLILEKNYTHSRKKLHSFSKKITLVLEKNYTRSRKKLHSFSKKITLILEKNYTHSRKKLHSFSKKITLILEKNYTRSRKKLHSFSKKITLKFE